MRISLRQEHHNLIYFIGLVLMAISLPLSKFVMSVSQFIILGNWLWEGNFKAKWQSLKSNKLLLAALSIYLLHLLGMLWTSDYAYGLKDLRIKLPLLALPLIIGTSKPLDAVRFRQLLGFLALSIFAGTMVSMYYYLGFASGEIYNTRDLSRFISHIRFSLLIVFSLASLVWMGFFSKEKTSLTLKFLLIGLCLWFCYFLFILDTLNGIVALGLVILATIIGQIFSIQHKALKYASIAVLIMLPLLSIVYISTLVKEHYGLGTKEDLSHLDSQSKKGTYYFNDTTKKQLENGHYVWIYIAYGELEQAWATRSDLPFDGKDKKGNQLGATVFRYMASRGLRKDAEGIAQLRDEEIEAIENGISSCRYFDGLGLSYRVSQTLFEFDSYAESGNPSGHSTTQRLEFWKAAIGIIQKNPVLGVGTGDLRKAYQNQYESMNSPLDMEHRLRAHNQYLSIGVAFGLVGLAVFLLAFFAPFLFTGFRPGYLYVIFFLICAFSMLSEDTLETQAGVSFFAFFNTLLLFAQPGIEKLKAYQFKG